jgi:hypothetical protein
VTVWQNPRVKRLPLGLAAGALVAAVLLPLSGVLDPPDPSGPPSPSAAIVATPTPAASDVTPAPPSEGAPGPTPTPMPATPVPTADALVVPVIQFRSSRTSTDLDDVVATLAGESERYEALELVADEADAILAELGVERPPAGDPRLVLAADAATLTADLAAHRDRLAFLRADDVTPAVRALVWDGTALFGNDRVRDAGAWPLVAALPVRAGTSPSFDPGATWTLFAAGDILLDRGVHETIHIKGRGVDFPFDGGTAEITSRYCCSSFGWELPRTRRTGDAGAVRRVIEGADIAIANLEAPVPDTHRWHTSGTVFAGDVRSLDGIAEAGIDYLGLANNHIGDAGRGGILQTIEHLEDREIAYSGAGADEDAARRPAVFEQGDTTVAILAYDRIARYYFADDETPGSAPLSVNRVRRDIERAREAGADVVIVFPHWGVEYRGTPVDSQQRQARAIIDAGADMIIGNHAHWAASLEIHDGKPIWYALGNFVFDQTWSEPTMEGITLELTFHGAELAQIRMRPHIILDKAQPNFLDPAGDGRPIMRQVFGDEDGLLPW